MALCRRSVSCSTDLQVEMPAVLTLLPCRVVARGGDARPGDTALLRNAGTGKTVFARATATEAGARLFVINGPDVMSEHYGDSEAAIRGIFAAAAALHPSVSNIGLGSFYYHGSKYENTRWSACL